VYGSHVAIYTSLHNTRPYNDWAMPDNPFRYGALALDEAFTDRARELAELRRDVLNGQDVVVFGRRRFGKSSLIWRVSADLLRRKVLVAYCDLMTTPTKERFAEKLAKTVHEDIASLLFRARERALAVFQGLRVTPRITVDPHDGSLSFSFDVGQRPADLDATVERLLALPGELGADRKRKVALILDEFQEITSIDPNYPRLMRAVFQTQPEVSHVYLGSKRHLMQKIFNDANEPFWRSAKPFELGPIDPAEFAPFIVARFEVSGRAIDDEAVAAILARTRGHPYATQQFAYFVWEESLDAGVAGVGHVERALDALLAAEHNHFARIWDEATPTEKLLLAALAEEAGRVFSADYRTRHGLPPATNIQRGISSLVRQELAGKDDEGRYEIVEPFLADWVRRLGV
jgi:uncharacterized protein